MKMKLAFPVILSVVFAVLLFDFSFEDSTDSGRFYSIGYSLAKEGSLKEYYVPGEISNTKIPPGVPVIVAASMKLTDENIILSKIFIFLFFVIAIIGVFRYFSLLEEIDTPSTGFDKIPLLVPIFLIIGASKSLLEYTHYIKSEVPYLALSVLCFIYLRRYIKESKLKWLIIASLFCGLGLNFRTIGFTLLLAIFTYLLIKREIKMCFMWLIPATILILPWVIGNFFVRGTATYIDEFITSTSSILLLPQRLLYNIASFAGIEAGMIYLQGGETNLLTIGNYHIRILTFLSIVLSFFIFIGFIKAIKLKKFLPEVLYTFFYYSIYFIWPSEWRDYRFDLVMLPFLTIYLVLGMKTILNLLRLDEKISLKIITIISLLIVLNNLIYASHDIKTRWPNNIRYLKGDKLAPYPDYFKAYVEASFYARDNIGKSSVKYQNPVFLTARPAVFFALSGHKALAYPLTKDPNELLKFCKEHLVTHIVYDEIYPASIEYLKPAVDNISQNEFKVIYKNSKVKIIEIIGDT